MKCPHCNAEKSWVRETRQLEEVIYRYRECRGCGRNYKTLEAIHTGPLPRERMTGQPTGPSTKQQDSPWNY